MWYFHDPAETYVNRSVSSIFNIGTPILEGDVALGKLMPRVAYFPDMWEKPSGDILHHGEVEVEVTHPSGLRCLPGFGWSWEDSVEYKVWCSNHE